MTTAQVKRFGSDITGLLKKGSQGHQVATLQILMRGVGYVTLLDGDFGVGLDRVVRLFQRKAGLKDDGVVGGGTLGVLQDAYAVSKSLKHSDILWAAKRLGIDVPSMLSVCEIESLGTGFLDDGRPKILFERHIMRRQLLSRGINPAPHEQSTPGLVNTKTGGYIGGAGEWGRLDLASKIDAKAAQASCSWGMFQVMGYHYQNLGYPSLESFVAGMRNSERDHLESFCRYVEDSSATMKALRTHDWQGFERAYNGPKDTDYDDRLKNAYARLSKTLTGYTGWDV